MERHIMQAQTKNNSGKTYEESYYWKLNLEEQLQCIKFVKMHQAEKINAIDKGACAESGICGRLDAIFSSAKPSESRSQDFLEKIKEHIPEILKLTWHKPEEIIQNFRLMFAYKDDHLYDIQNIIRKARPSAADRFI
ncbi:hypothetical protein FQN50_006459 [Emmonsiellopsis sp. PD_5]|nr:hypothetical protein FQN50_006459 [Emmonsiellopsis sp. PD_5]